MAWLDSKLICHQAWRRWRGIPDPTPIHLVQFQREAEEALNLLMKNLGENVKKEYTFDWVSTPKKTITVKRPQRMCCKNETLQNSNSSK